MADQPEGRATKHARLRFLERYGGDLTDDDAALMLQDIRAGRGILMAKQDSHEGMPPGERWLVLSGGLPVHIVVNVGQDTVITALPIAAKRRQWEIFRSPDERGRPRRHGSRRLWM